VVSALAGEARTLAECERHYRAGDYDAAAALLLTLLEDDPGNAPATGLLGMCRLRANELALALPLLARARKLAPNDPYLRLNHGLGLQEAGEHAAAADAFRSCAQALPLDPAPFLNLAAALIALDRAADALDAAKRARRRAPRLPQAHYMVGLALLGVSRTADAETSFAAALRLAPRFSDGWLNLGVARYRCNNIAGAKAAMRQALAIDPNNRAAAANLGSFMRFSGEGEAGEALLREFLTRDPDAIEIRLNFVADLLEEERVAEALAVLDAAPPPAAPRLRCQWQLQRSLALLQLGRRDEALAALVAAGDIPPELRALGLRRRLALAIGEGDQAGAEAQADALAAALPEPGVLPEHRIMGHYHLARFWLQRNADKAFAQWTEGHRALAKFQPFSREPHRAFVDANIARFDQARFSESPRAGNGDRAPVFIVGMPRSGTTLCEQIIAAHAKAHGAGERGALTQAWNALGGAIDSAPSVERIAALEAAALDRSAEIYLRELHALAPDADRIVDKMPGNFLFLGLVGLMLPGARIIHCMRDPRDVGLSIFTFRFYGHHPYAHDLADLGWYIAEHDRLMAHWKAVLPNPILSVQLKDWVEDAQGTLTHVLDFIDLPYDPACERFYEQDSKVRTVSRNQVRQPINAHGLGRWRRHERQLQPLIAALAEAGALSPE
jgi:tetratricopeptide (TPR) repeat protein